MKISREFLVGVVVVITIAILYLGVSYLKGINLFSKQQRFYAEFDKVAGLVPSNPVVLNGFKIGIVRSVKMSEKGDGKIVVEAVIDDSNLKLPIDSKLEIYDADLFGAKAIQIIMGSSTTYAQNHDTLQSSIQLGLTESLKQELEPLKSKTTQLFASIDSVLGALNGAFSSKGQENIGDIFRSLKTTLKNLETTTASVNNLLADNTSPLASIMDNVNSITTNLKNNNDELTNAIQNFSSLSDSMAKLNLSSTMQKVDKALGDFNAITNKINTGNGTLAQLINNDSLHHELVSASHSLDLLLNDMQTNPNRYVAFSLFGRKDKSEEFSKRELEQIREEIKSMLKEKPAAEN